MPLSNGHMSEFVCNVAADELRKLRFCEVAVENLLIFPMMRAVAVGMAGGTGGPPDGAFSSSWERTDAQKAMTATNTRGSGFIRSTPHIGQQSCSGQFIYPKFASCC